MTKPMGMPATAPTRAASGRNWSAGCRWFWNPSACRGPVITVICIIYVLPILIVLMNSFKSNAAVNTETFALPNEDTSWVCKTISRA